MKKKVIIYLSLTSFALITIFLLSSSNASNSNELSKGLINFFINLYEKITHKDLYNELIIVKLNYPVRKLAHFTEYFILAIIIYKLLFYVNKNVNLIYFNTILLCIMFASFDEFHQLFVSNRTGRLFDILIDTSGSLLSIIIIYLYTRNKKCKINKNDVSKNVKKSL